MKLRQVAPFETNDEKITKLLSFYLHYAPTIESKTASNIDENKLKVIGLSFLKMLNFLVLKFIIVIIN